MIMSGVQSPSLSPIHQRARPLECSTPNVSLLMATVAGSEDEVVSFKLMEILGEGATCTVKKAVMLSDAEDPDEATGPAGIPRTLVVKCFKATVLPEEVCYEAKVLTALRLFMIHW